MTLSCQPAAQGDAATTPAAVPAGTLVSVLCERMHLTLMSPLEVGTVILIVHMRKPRHKEAQYFVQDHTAVEPGVKSLHSGSLVRTLNTRPITSCVRRAPEASYNSETCII